MSAEIVPLRAGPSLMDVAEQMRALADRVEAGEFGDDPTMIVTMPRPGDWPDIFGWGPTSVAETVFVLQQAIVWFANNEVSR